MTLNDIIGKRIAIKEFYFRHLANMGTTIAEAAKEPLKLRDVQAWEHFDMLPTKEIKQVRPGEALCFYCLCNLIKRANRSRNPSPEDVAYMAEQMIKEYDDWSVLDLPTFVNNVINAHVASLTGSQMDYQLVSLDCLSIMGKVRAYNLMRPNALALQGNSPAKASTLQPIKSKHYGMLMDGTPYDFRVPYEDYVQGYSTPSGSPTVNAERYWRASPHNGEEDFERFYANYRAKLIGQDIIQPVNKVLGLQ